MTKDKQIILDYLQSHSNRKVSVQEMLGKLQSEGFKYTRRGLRFVFEEMIEEGCLIGSNSTGLFWIDTPEKMNAMVAYTKSTAISLFKKATPYLIKKL